MKTKKFQKLLVEYAEKTVNIRALKTKWCSGVYRIPDEITTKIGCIVALLQAKIDVGYFCKKNEYLMIYNFQPLHTSEDVYLCSLDMVIKPTKEINELENCKGVPLQLVVNGTTGEIGNNSYGLVAMEIASIEEVETEGEAPLVYGNYKEYSEPQVHDFASKLSLLQATSETLKEKEIQITEAEMSALPDTPKVSEEEAEIERGSLLVYGNYKGYSEPQIHDFASKLSLLQATSKTLKEKEIQIIEAETSTLSDISKSSDICFSFQQKVKTNSLDRKPTPPTLYSSFSVEKETLDLLRW